MNWLTRAEARFGYLAIPGLPYIIVGFNVLVYVLSMLDSSYTALLDLDMAQIAHGQVWRLVTFVFIPRYGGFLLPAPLRFVLYVLFLYYVGTGLERAMGSFRFTVYYVCGMLGLIAAAAIAGPYVSAMLLNFSLLFAFARYFPDSTMLLYVIPVRVIWIAWFEAAYMGWLFVTEGMEMRLSIVAVLANFMLFFGGEILRDARHRQQTETRRARFEREMRQGTSASLHECAVCHRTESTPDLEFRIARDGEEYCVEHLPKPAAG